MRDSWAPEGTLKGKEKCLEQLGTAGDMVVEGQASVGELGYRNGHVGRSSRQFVVMWGTGGL